MAKPEVTRTSSGKGAVIVLRETAAQLESRSTARAERAASIRARLASVRTASR